MNTSKKQQVGPRVKRESYETLQRLAAANGSTLGHYIEGVLEEHVARQQHPDAGGGVMHELVVDIDNRFAAHVQRLQNVGARDLTAAVLKIEKLLDVLKVMMDVMVRTLSPKDHEAYTKAVKATLQRLGPLFGEHENGNRRLQ